MKKLLNVKFVLLIAMLLSTSSCNITDPFDELISECDAKENQITPADITFDSTICKVRWKDGSHASDLTVKMQIHKEYCSGKTAGHMEVYVPNRTTNEIGAWSSYYKATYTYKNKKDRVLVKFIIAPGAYDWEYDFVYRWEDVESFVHGGKATLYHSEFITLPINEDGS